MANYFRRPYFAIFSKIWEKYGDCITLVNFLESTGFLNLKDCKTGRIKCLNEIVGRKFLFSAIFYLKT